MKDAFEIEERVVRRGEVLAVHGSRPWKQSSKRVRRGTVPVSVTLRSETSLVCRIPTSTHSACSCRGMQQQLLPHRGR